MADLRVSAQLRRAVFLQLNRPGVVNLRVILLATGEKLPLESNDAGND